MVWGFLQLFQMDLPVYCEMPHSRGLSDTSAPLEPISLNLGDTLKAYEY